MAHFSRQTNAMKGAGNKSRNDRAEEFTRSTASTTFDIPSFAFDDKGAHTIKNALTRVIFSPDSIKRVNLPKGIIRRGQTQVKYLVPCENVDGKIPSIIDRWLDKIPYRFQIVEDSFFELIATCSKEKVPCGIPGSPDCYDLAPFITAAFAVTLWAESEDFSASFVIQEPLTTFLETRDSRILDAELRSRLAAVFFFRLNDEDRILAPGKCTADDIIVSNLCNSGFNLSHSWEKYWTNKGTKTKADSLIDYRRKVMDTGEVEFEEAEPTEEREEIADVVNNDDAGLDIVDEEFGGSI